MEENKNQANAAEEFEKALSEETPEERKKKVEELQERLKEQMEQRKA